MKPMCQSVVRTAGFTKAITGHKSRMIGRPQPQAMTNVTVAFADHFRASQCYFYSQTI